MLFDSHSLVFPQTSLTKLLGTLAKAEPFFIRCIRSNAEKVRPSGNTELMIPTAMMFISPKHFSSQNLMTQFFLTINNKTELLEWNSNSGYGVIL